MARARAVDGSVAAQLRRVFDCWDAVPAKPWEAFAPFRLTVHRHSGEEPLSLGAMTGA